MAAGLGAPFEFLLSGFSEEHEEKELNNIMTKIRELGGRANNAPTYVSKCTHVISYKPIRSEKFLCGVASGKWILKPEFITDSFARSKWQPESMYEWSEGDVSENVLPGLLTAPRRWREKIAASGHGAFHDWKVLLHVDVTNQNRYAFCRRLLEAGGGQCVSVTFPIKEPAGLVSLITHVIVEKCYEKDIQCLEAGGITCLPPEFIMDHLFQENPNMTHFHESSALITPPGRQRNIVVPTVRAKKDHDMQTNPSGRERDTPGSTTSLAEDDTSSDPGSSVKRKLDLSPDSPSEPLLMLKKRKHKNPKDASTSKAANVRRSLRLVKGGSRLQSNTKVEDRSRETLPSKPNSGKDKESSPGKTNENGENRKVPCSSIARYSLRSSSRKANVNCKNPKVPCSSNTDHSPRSSPKKNRKNAKGETPLHVACIKNNITRVRELLNEPDIDVNARDNAEWTPLHEACNHGHTDCVKELLKFAPGKRKITSTESKSMQTLDLLAAPSECGTTPLHDAVNNNQIEVVKLLVEAGGRSLLTVKNKAVLTPVDMAQTEVMKEAILGQRSEVSNFPTVDEECENTSVSRSIIAHHSRRSSPRNTNVNRKNF